jgi:hypothetical protein
VFVHEIAREFPIIPPDPSQLQLPRWLRVPAAIQYSGLPRSSLFRLLSENVIKSASLCSPGKTRGVRIIDRLELDRVLSDLTNKQTISHSEIPAPTRSVRRKCSTKDPRLSKAAATVGGQP